MKITFVYYMFYLRQLLRQPSYVLSTLVFPSLFFLFFARPNIQDPAGALLLMGSFASFAIIGVMIFQFGVEVSVERSSSWWVYQSTLPVSPGLQWLARGAVSLTFALVSALVVVGTVRATTDVVLSSKVVAATLAALVLGSIPFGFLGLVVGFTFSGRSALPAANLIYIVLSFLGGLWVPPAGMNEKLQEVSKWMPTRHFAEWVWAASRLDWPAERYQLLLGADLLLMCVLFALIARKPRAT